MLKRSESLGSCDEKNILDISSGFLFLAGGSLVPESITKNCLFNAKVLQQVDKKFIPVAAGGVLAVIDQVLFTLLFSCITFSLFLCLLHKLGASLLS